MIIYNGKEIDIKYSRFKTEIPLEDKRALDELSNLMWPFR